MPQFPQIYDVLFGEDAGDSMPRTTETVHDLADSLNSLKDAYDALSAAQKDMNENGSLSADTIKALKKVTDNNHDYLYE